MSVGHSTMGLTLALAVLAAGCGSDPTAPSKTVDFIVDVSGERFILRTSNPETIQLAEENLRRENSRFPAGPLRAGNGGFNAPWTWHLDPSATQMVEVAIEICDGRPSYVESHQQDYQSYCPWGAKIVGRR